MSPSTSTYGKIKPSTYKSLGVRPAINGAGTYTTWSGSRMIDVAAEAMVEATNGYVAISDLMEKVGQRLADITGAEWGYVASSCAGAINNIAAAAITGGDPEKMWRLPDTTGMKNEIIEEACLRSGYEPVIQVTGARIVTVETESDLRAAVNERTALIMIDGDSETRSKIGVPRMIAIGNELGIPVFVDAAAQRCDVPNRYLKMGADAVAFSGGKCLRGPQSTGLVLGKKNLLWAAFQNAAPHGTQGRGAKVGKEEIMSLLAAVEAFVLGRDHAAEWKMWEGYLETVRLAVANLPSVKTEIDQPGIANVTPYLNVHWDAAVIGATAGQIIGALLEGEPRILVNGMPDGVRVNPYMLEAGDAEIIAKRLRDLLTHPPVAAPVPAVQPPTVDVSGEWTINIQFLASTSTHTMKVEQKGAEFSGAYRSQYDRSEVKGTLAGKTATFQATLKVGMFRPTYVFTGVVTGGTMSGTASVGQEWPVKWSAKRS
jgi:seryl-tRNA(Sec) selenium transferase